MDGHGWPEDVMEKLKVDGRVEIPKKVGRRRTAQEEEGEESAEGGLCPEGHEESEEA